MMEKFEYGNLLSNIVLIQLVDEHDLEGIEKEVDTIKNNGFDDFKLIALKVENWNKDLSPWKAPAVFGKEEFGDGAKKTLDEVVKYCSDKTKTYYIGGYSLAGLFALWASYQTDIFKGVACASPSMWFPRIIEYIKVNKIKSDAVYLSLGDKEEKSRNPVMATVGEKIKEAYGILSREIKCVLEWNEGNHFKDADLRTARAFSWLLKH